MLKAKVMLKAEASAGAAVGEAVEAEAGVDGGHPRRHHLRLHLLHCLLRLRGAAMLGIRRWSSLLGSTNPRTASFDFPPLFQG